MFIAAFLVINSSSISSSSSCSISASILALFGNLQALKIIMLLFIPFYDSTNIVVISSLYVYYTFNIIVSISTICFKLTKY